MDPARIAIRSLFVFIFLLALLRISGRRVVSQATPFELVESLILGDLVDDVMFAEVPASEFIVAAGVIMLLQFIISVCNHFKASLYFLFAGKPAKLFINGEPQRSSMSREKLRIADLEHLTRSSGLGQEKWSQIELGILENSGSLSIQRTDGALEVRKKDTSLLKKSKQ